MGEIDDSDSNLETHFIKQRRGFIALCFAIIFYRTFGFPLDGMLKEIANLPAFHVFVGFIFLYGSWRFNAACCELLVFINIKSQYNNILGGIASEYAKDKLCRIYDVPQKEKSKLHLSSLATGNPNYKRSRYTVDDNTEIPKDLRDRIYKNQFFDLGRLDMLRIHIQSVGNIILYKKSVGEYIFPYVLAFLTLWELIGCGLVSKFLDVMVWITGSI